MCVCFHGVIAYVEYPKESTPKIPSISEFNKCLGYKFNFKTLIAFLYTTYNVNISVIIKTHNSIE